MNKVMYRLAPLALAIALSGCAIAPDAGDQGTQLPDSFRQVSIASEAAALSYDNWPSLYGDAVLDALLLDAVDATDGKSLDIAKALAQLEQAQAAVEGAKASLWPTLGLSAEGSKGRQHVAGASVHSQSQGVSAIGRYELDLWGRLSNQAESADLQAQSSAQALNAVRKKVTQQVVTQYWVLRQVDSELALLSSQIEARSSQQTLAENRLKYGTGTELDVKQAQARVANAKRERVGIETQRQQLEETLGLLVGASDLRVAKRASHVVGSSLDKVSGAIPSQVMAQRSDVQQAEYALQAAGMSVAVARAAMFPSISFSAQGGGRNDTLNTLFQPGNSFWTLGYSVDLPIFDRGLRLSQIDKAKAVQRERMADYQKAVQSAFHDVNNALIEMEGLERASVHLGQELEAAQSAYEMATYQYESGLIGYSSLLDTQQSHDDAQRAHVKLDYERKIAEANYFHSLGF